MFPILLAGEVKLNQSQLVADIGRSLTAAADCLRTDASAILAILKVGFLFSIEIYGTFTLGFFSTTFINVCVCIFKDGDGGDMAALATHMIAISETLAAQLKTARRRIPQGQQEGVMLSMGLEAGLASALQDCCTNHATRVTRLIRDVVRSGLAVISNIGGECCCNLSTELFFFNLHLCHYTHFFLF